jgi:hypothetical protein
MRFSVPVTVTIEARDIIEAQEAAKKIQNMLDQAVVQMQLKVNGVQARELKVHPPSVKV